MDILKAYIDQAMKYQSEIDNLDPDDDDRGELEDFSVSTKSMFLSLLSKNPQPSLQENSLSLQRHHARLPNMKLQKFTGKYSEYKNFMSLFENLVHNDPMLTDIEKI